MVQYLEPSLETEEGGSSELLLTPTQQTLLDVPCSLESQMDLVRSKESKESWVDHLELFMPAPQICLLSQEVFGKEPEA